MKFIYKKVLTVKNWLFLNLLGIPLTLSHLHEKFGSLHTAQVIGIFLLPTLFMMISIFIIHGISFFKIGTKLFLHRNKSLDGLVCKSFIDPLDEKTYHVTTPKMFSRFFEIDLFSAMVYFRYSHETFKIYRQSKNQFLIQYKTENEA